MSTALAPDAGWTTSSIPSADVLAGDPQTRTQRLHVSHHGGIRMDFWDCTAGRFRWHYPGDEMVQILEGEVHVTFEDGVARTLRAGDTAHFKAGTTLEWDVPEYVRKVAFHRSPQSLPDRVFSKGMSVARRLPGLNRRRTPR